MKKSLTPEEKLTKHYAIDKHESRELDYQLVHDAKNVTAPIRRAKAQRARLTYDRKK